VDEGIEVAEFQFQHQDAKWERPRRYVVVRQREVSRRNLRQKILWIHKRLESVGDNRIAVEPQPL
jgi:hypothetical protein